MPCVGKHLTGYEWHRYHYDYFQGSRQTISHPRQLEVERNLFNWSCVGYISGVDDGSILLAHA